MQDEIMSCRLVVLKLGRMKGSLGSIEKNVHVLPTFCLILIQCFLGEAGAWAFSNKLPQRF